MLKHKVGTRVKVTDELSFHYNSVGVVTHFNEELHYNVFVRFENNERCNFRHKELERVE